MKNLEINERTNFIDNLEKVAYFLNSSDQFKWKWISISLFQALYCSLILSLIGTDSRQTVVDRKHDSGRSLILHANNVPDFVIAFAFGKTVREVRQMYSNPRLISFDIALKKAKNGEFRPKITDEIKLVLSDEEEKAIRLLCKEFRNQFEHFLPTQWLIETTGLPNMVTCIIRIIKFLVFETQAPCFSLEEEQRIENVLNQICVYCQ